MTIEIDLTKVNVYGSAGSESCGSAAMHIREQGALHERMLALVHELYTQGSLEQAFFVKTAMDGAPCFFSNEQTWKRSQSTASSTPAGTWTTPPSGARSGSGTRSVSFTIWG